MQQERKLDRTLLHISSIEELICGSTLKHYIAQHWPLVDWCRGLDGFQLQDLCTLWARLQCASTASMNTMQYTSEKSFYIATGQLFKTSEGRRVHKVHCGIVVWELPLVSQDVPTSTASLWVQPLTHVLWTAEMWTQSLYESSHFHYTQDFP